MKYVWRNIRSFLIGNKFLFTLVVLSVSGSCIMIHFAYGLFQNYQLEKEYNLLGQKEVHITLADNFQEESVQVYKGKKLINQVELVVAPEKLDAYVTVDLLRDFAEGLGGAFNDSLDYIMVNPVVDDLKMECAFCVTDGRITNSEAFEKTFNSDMDNTLSRGRYFSYLEYLNGEKVAVCWDLYNFNVVYEEDGSVITNSPVTEDMMVNDDTLMIQGKEYQIIGFGSYLFGIDRSIVPLTSLDGDTPMMGYITLNLNQSITMTQYQLLEEQVDKVFGRLATLQPMELPSEDAMYLYNTILLIAVLITLVAALNFAILYRYILSTRKKPLAVYRICGLTFGGAVRMYLLECFFLTLPLYIVGVAVFSFCILPVLSARYTYMHGSFNLIVYACMFAIYYGVSFLILLSMIVYNLHKDEKLRIGGGYQ